MLKESITIQLKDGRTAMLRNPEISDAQAMLDCLKQTAEETHFILRTPKECEGMTVEDEARFIQRMREYGGVLMYVCEVDGKMAGNGQIAFNNRDRTWHRASIAIGLLKEYWGLGIGTAILQALIDEARARKIRQVELEFMEGNSRGRALYEKLGFRITGMRLDCYMLEDGTLLNEYHMTLKL